MRIESGNITFPSPQRSSGPESPIRLIIIDDSKEYMTLLRRMLANAIPDIEVTEYDPEQQGRPGDDFDWALYDVLLIDYQLGVHESGLEWIKTYSDFNGFPPCILMTSVGDEYVAASAIKLGASDYIKKDDINTDRIAAIVRAAAKERQRSEDDVTTLGSTLSSLQGRDRNVFNRVRFNHDTTPDGKRIGYRFVRLIGQGASSRVYLAERLSDRMTLVLKIIDVLAIKEPQALQRFVQEAELVSELNSPFVVKFLEHGFTKDYGYIAMEFFTRGDLKQRIEHGVSLSDALNYISHIGYGLSAIHAAGIVHRDLKPGNIMFRSDDSLAIADFGISKRLDETGEMTKLGSVLGTPNYLSPEQALGDAVDHRSDLYSAGVVLYEMLTGQKPFKAETASGLVYQHVHADIPQLPQHVRNFQPVIEMLLAKDPNDRFGSASEFIHSLNSIDRASHTIS